MICRYAKWPRYIIMINSFQTLQTNIFYSTAPLHPKKWETTFWRGRSQCTALMPAKTFGKVLQTCQSKHPGIHHIFTSKSFFPIIAGMLVLCSHNDIWNNKQIASWYEHWYEQKLFSRKYTCQIFRQIFIAIYLAECSENRRFL